MFTNTRQFHEFLSFHFVLKKVKFFKRFLWIGNMWHGIFLNYRLKWIGNLSKVVCSRFCNFFANHSPQTMLRNVRCSKNLKNSTGKKIFKNIWFQTYFNAFIDIRTSIVIWYMSSPSWGPRMKLLGHSQAWSSKTMSKLISTNFHPKWPLS